MSFFGNILEKLGLRKRSTAQTNPAQRPTSQPTGSSRSGTPQSSGGSQGAAAGLGSSAQGRTSSARIGELATGSNARPTAMVDVVGHLEGLAAKNPQKLNWRTSIVDLLKLLDIDSSPDARKELADELGAPPNLKDGSAEMNTWLHRTVLRKIAENGGNVPQELLD